MAHATDEPGSWGEFAAWLRARYDNPRARPARRTCLGPRCRGRRSFESEHAGQRICPRCRALLGAVYGAFPGFEDAP